MNLHPEIIEFQKIKDERGNLTFFEYPGQTPFEIKRTYWIYNVPGGEFRGGHAYKSQQEIIISLSGSFEVNIFDGVVEKKYILNKSNQGLFIPSLHWRTIVNFSTNSLALIISDNCFDENDYIRDFEFFKTLVNV
ncbi:MAG: hypothetical protein RL638_216 [Bacteroidota bacterium]|jgi:hypothetical protein